MDRAVPAFHGEAGFDDVAVLQHVVSDQYAVLIKDTQDFRQEVDVLSLSGVHKDKIVRAIQGFKTSAASPGISVMRSQSRIFSKFSRAIGMRFS